MRATQSRLRLAWNNDSGNQSAPMHGSCNDNGSFYLASNDGKISLAGDSTFMMAKIYGNYVNGTPIIGGTLMR